MTDMHVELAAYLLDALDEAEREAFEVHLAECETCGPDARDLGDVVAELGLLVAAPPPAELRASILDAVRGVPQLAPDALPGLPEPADSELTASYGREGDTTDTADTTVTTPLTGTAGPASAEPRRIESAAQPEPGHEAIGGARATRGGPDELSERRAARPRRAQPTSRTPRWLLAAVAAALVAVLGLGGWVAVLVQQRQEQAAQATAEAQLFSAADVRVYPGNVRGRPVSFVVSKSLGRAMFIGPDLPPAGAGKTYQLWTIPAGQVPVPDALFDGGAPRRLFLVGNVTGAAALALSIENSGGADQPTADQIQLLTTL